MSKKIKITESQLKILMENNEHLEYSDELLDIISGHVKDPDEAIKYSNRDPEYWPDWLSANIERDPSYQKYLSSQNNSGEKVGIDGIEQRMSSDEKNGYGNFEDHTKLINSATDRLYTALQLRQWELVEEVLRDLARETKRSKEDVVPNIGDESSVMSDTEDESMERNFGVNENIDKIKSNFKRFL